MALTAEDYAIQWFLTLLLETFQNIQYTEYGPAPQQTQLDGAATVNHLTAETFPERNLGKNLMSVFRDASGGV